MNVQGDQPLVSTSNRPEPAGFHAPSIAAWLAATIPLALGAGWLTVFVEPYFAPLVVFPLLVGSILGMGLVGWMRICGMAHRKSAALGVFVTVAAFVVAAHYFAYSRVQHRFDEQFEQFRRTRIDLGGLTEIQESTRPKSMVSFMRQAAEKGRPLAGRTVRGAGVWLWWGLDAGLTLAGAFVPVWFALKRPFCPRCRSWFRVARGGPIDRHWACEIAGRLGMPLASSGGAAYQLLSCRAGCAPSAFELSWNESSAGDHCLFLDAPQREEVTTILDRAVSQSSAALPKTPD
jgi:hypothetical protein